MKWILGAVAAYLLLRQNGGGLNFNLPIFGAPEVVAGTPLVLPGGYTVIMPGGQHYRTRDGHTYVPAAGGGAGPAGWVYVMRDDRVAGWLNLSTGQFQQG